MYKKILLFLFFCFVFLSLPVKALRIIGNDFEEFENFEISDSEESYILDNVESMNSILNFVQLSTQIDNASSTIIPNKLMAENKDGDLRQLSADIILNIERISSQSSEVRFVIGDAKAVTEQEYEYLCRIVQSEAGNQDLVGKVLIANVIFNRVESYKFSNDIVSVILSPGQFSPVSNGRFFRCTISDETKQAVDQALNGVDYSDGALYFMARRAAYRGAVLWFDTSLTYLFKHGGHEFFK